MDARLLVLGLLLAPWPVAAQEPAPGPELVVLVHHPFPDDADILGVPFASNCTRPCDAFAVRHGGMEPFSDGVAYPGFVADGRLSMEGLVGGDRDATLAAYEDRVQARLATDTPLTITVGTRVEDNEVRSSIWIETVAPVGEGLRLWVALVEDPVHYEPPPALSNGVFDHPFTVRLVQDVGAIAPQPGAEVRRDLGLGLDEAWAQQNMRLAAWVEQDRQALGTFGPGEVVQAASHPLLSGGLTRQSERAVLVEAYSAAWCDPCLVGDNALEALAEDHGLPTGRALVEGRSYLRQPALPAAFVAVAAAAGFVFFALLRVEGRR